MFLEAGFVTIEDGIVTMVTKKLSILLIFSACLPIRLMSRYYQAEALLNYQPIRQLCVLKQKLEIVH